MKEEFESSSDICKCGHRKFFHRDSKNGLGEGPCKMCDCKKFKKNWVATKIYKNE